MSTMSTPPSTLNLNLIPYPQHISFHAGSCPLSPATVIRLLAGASDADLHTATLLSLSIAKASAFAPELRPTPAPPGHPGPDIHLLEQTLAFSGSPEAYRLRITPGAIEIAAATPQGRFYGAQTLCQLLLQFGPALPAFTIEDYPDLPHRGVMLDVSRGKVPLLATLFTLVERLAALKLNQLQLYIEHTFAFECHPLPGLGRSPLTPSDIMALDAHCRRHHVALVPNLQSFGHVHETLIHERYRPLAESDFRDGWTLSPAVPEIYEFLAELYAEFLPCFSHRPFFNVDCDETWDLGKGKSAPLAQKHGLGRVYLDHLLKVRQLLEPHGCRMLFWGDILERHPELIPELPRDVVLLNWFYDAHGEEARYLNRARPAQLAGLEHWVCPGASAWLSFFFRKDNARDNIAAWAAVARETGARGLLNTDWGDAGHLNHLSFSYWSFAWGADRAWRAQPDPAAPAEFDRRFLATQLPGAPTAWLKALDLLGNLYLAFAPSGGRPSMVHRALLSGDFIMHEGRPTIRFFYGRLWPMPSEEELLAALEASRRALAILETERFNNDELNQVRREWINGAELGIAACRRGLAWHGHEAAGSPASRRAFLTGALERLQTAWLLRNRPSDLAAILESLALPE